MPEDEIYELDFLAEIINNSTTKSKGEAWRYCQGDCLSCCKYDNSKKDNFLEPGKNCTSNVAGG